MHETHICCFSWRQRERAGERIGGSHSKALAYACREWKGEIRERWVDV